MKQVDRFYGTVQMIATLLALATLGSCGGGSGANTPAGDTAPAGPTVPTAVSEALKAGALPDPALVAADNGFGLALLDSLIPTATGNVAISPLSVAMVLQIVYNGAAGTTQTAMAQTLQLGGLTPAALNGENAALQASLINADPVVQVTIANSLWMHLNTNPVLSSFVQTDQTYYGATIGDLSGAPGNVNVWISAETQGLIAQILPPGPASEYQRIIAVIANAVYFKGQWTTAFDASQTASAAFTLADGSQTQASLMHQSGSYPYLQGNWQGIAFQALRIPYGTGRLSMLIVLPAPGTSIGPFVASMTAAALAGWTAQLQIGAGSIALPRFSTAYGTSLVPALSVLGMGVAFCTSNAADFAALAPRTCLSDVEHKTVVEVDEAGTVAAAATTVTVSPTVVVASPPPFRMIMDHPFFYAVQDDLTGELLFIGILAQPSG